MTDLEHQVLVNLIAEYGANEIRTRIDDIVADAEDPDICANCGRDYRGEPLAADEKCICETEEVGG